MLIDGVEAVRCEIRDMFSRPNAEHAALLGTQRWRTHRATHRVGIKIVANNLRCPNPVLVLQILPMRSMKEHVIRALVKDDSD